MMRCGLTFALVRRFEIFPLAGVSKLWSIDYLCHPLLVNKSLKTNKNNY